MSQLSRAFQHIGGTGTFDQLFWNHKIERAEVEFEVHSYPERYIIEGSAITSNEEKP
jgi:hypothetical protein